MCNFQCIFSSWYLEHSLWNRSREWVIIGDIVNGLVPPSFMPPYDVTMELYNDVMMSAMVSRITSLTIVYLSVYSGADQRIHLSPASLAFVRGIHRWPVNSSHKGPVTRKMFPFDDVIMGMSQTFFSHSPRTRSMVWATWVWSASSCMSSASLSDWVSGKPRFGYEM